MRRVLIVGCLLGLVAAGCGWARPRFDAGNSGANPFETKIGAANVASLTKSFSVASATASAIPAFVVARNHIYVGGSPVRVFAADGQDGCVGATCSPQWSTNFGGAPDVMGSTLYLGTTAFDADGYLGCTGAPKSCTPRWIDQQSGIPTGPVDAGSLHFSYGGFSFRGIERVFLMGHPSPETPECIGAFSLTSCPAGWQTFLGGGSDGGTTAVPAVGGGVVYAIYGPVGVNGGSLFAFDGTNAAAPQLWSAALPGPPTRSVVVSGGVVVTGYNSPDGEHLVGFDASGSVGCAGSPKVCTPLWSTDAVSGATSAAPALANGVLYRSVGSQLRVYDVHGVTNCSGSPKVCFPMWKAFVGPNVSAPAVANGLVYVSSSDGTVGAIDAAGNAQCSATTRVCSALWDTNVGAAAGAIEVDNGRVYVPVADGTVSVYALP